MCLSILAPILCGHHVLKAGAGERGGEEGLQEGRVAADSTIMRKLRP